MVVVRQDKLGKSSLLESSGEKALLCCFSSLAEENTEEAPAASQGDVQVRFTRGFLHRLTSVA